MIADVLFNVGRELFNLFCQIRGKKIEQKTKVADYFSNLAQVIEDTSILLKQGTYPHGQCAELHVYADKMFDTIKSVIGKEPAKKYAEMVLNVWRIEGMFEELQSIADEQKQAQLKKLDSSAGYFRGISSHIRVSQ